MNVLSSKVKALVDGGANGGIAGSADSRRMDPLSHLDLHVNVTGVGEHTINDIPIARFCAVSQSQYGNVLCVYHEYVGGNIQERTIHSKIQLMDYGNKVDDTAMSLGGQQTIITHGGHIFPLSLQNGFCHLLQQIPTDEEMRVLPQVIMISDRVWDPSIYDDKITMSEYFKHLPHIPAGENKEMYDIEGNLDIEASLGRGVNLQYLFNIGLQYIILQYSLNIFPR